MDISIVLSSFALLFLAEMGDKSQLIAMTLAHRYRIGPVIAGVFLAFLVLNGLAVLVGEALFRYVPNQLVLLTAGALFLFFAYRAWRDSAEGDEDAGVKRLGGTILRRVPQTWMHRAAALLFLVFGLLAFTHVLLDGSNAVIAAGFADPPLT